MLRRIYSQSCISSHHYIRVSIRGLSTTPTPSQSQSQSDNKAQSPRIQNELDRRIEKGEDLTLLPHRVVNDPRQLLFQYMMERVLEHQSLYVIKPPGAKRNAYAHREWDNVMHKHHLVFKRCSKAKKVVPKNYLDRIPGAMDSELEPLNLIMLRKLLEQHKLQPHKPLNELLGTIRRKLSDIVNEKSLRTNPKECIGELHRVLFDDPEAIDDYTNQKHLDQHLVPDDLPYPAPEYERPYTPHHTLMDYTAEDNQKDFANQDFPLRYTLYPQRLIYKGKTMNSEQLEKSRKLRQSKLLYLFIYDQANPQQRMIMDFWAKKYREVGLTEVLKLRASMPNIKVLTESGVMGLLPPTLTEKQRAEAFSGMINRIRTMPPPEFKTFLFCVVTQFNSAEQREKCLRLSENVVPKLMDQINTFERIQWLSTQLKTKTP